MHDYDFLSFLSFFQLDWIFVFVFVFAFMRDVINDFCFGFGFGVLCLMDEGISGLVWLGWIGWDGHGGGWDRVGGRNGGRKQEGEGKGKGKEGEGDNYVTFCLNMMMHRLNE